MRHQKKRHKLGRTHSHRKATLAALTTALVAHKRITTTLPKARALRTYIEPIVTRAKDDTTHNRREVFRHLQDKAAVTTLFTEVADAVGDRPGGYTRIVKLGQRAGDGAEMAVIELVDFGAEGPETSKSGRRRTRRGGSGRGRRGKKTTQAAAATQATVETSDQRLPEKGVATDVVEEPVSEAQAVPVPERTEPNAEAEAIAAEKATDAPEASAETAEAEQDEAPAAEADTAEVAPAEAEEAAPEPEAEAAVEETDVAEQPEAKAAPAEAEAETEDADAAEQPEAKAEGEETADESADDEEKQ